MLASATLKHINQLQQKKYRRECQEFLVEGVKGVSEALASQSETLLVVIDGKLRDDEAMDGLIALAKQRGVAIEFCGRKDIGEIKTTDTFPGVLAVVSQKDVGLDELENGAPIIALDGLKDPGNLGTIIRTADWFGITNILLGDESVDPYNPKVVRSTMGSIFHTKIFMSKNIVQSLATLKSRARCKIFALDIKGKPLPMSGLRGTAGAPVIFLFGSESHGLRPELAELINERYTIPSKGRAESLNVAAAAAILMSRL